MQRSFSPIDLVTVPRVSAASALALGAAVLATARSEPALPDLFVAPLGRLAKEHGALRTSRQYQREARAIDPAAATAADLQLDSCWSGFHAFLTGWTKLRGTAESVENGRLARGVLEIVFPDGLRFLNLPYREQWGESQTRLDRLAEPAIAESVSALGGDAFVRAIDLAQVGYGAALHVTERKVELAARANVRAPLDRFWEAMRSYVLQVAAYLDDNKDDPEARRIGRALLEPLATWKGGGKRKAVAPEALAGDESGGEADGG